MSVSTFKPAWWLPGPHLQTIWPSLCRERSKSLNLEHERFELPDGDFLDLAWTINRGPIVIILHGLEGSVQSSYAAGILEALVKQGWRGLFMHFRGCSGEPNRLPRAYHSGETQDLAWVVEAVQKRYPGVPLAAIGFSLGANVLLKWLGETGAKNPLSAASAVSAPFELHKAVKRLQKGFSKFYQWHLLNCLRKTFSKKIERHSFLDSFSALSTVKTLWDFDEQITAPLHGFAGAEEYYALSSSRQYLNKIRVPTLLLHAADDPFMTEDLIPEQRELPEEVCLELSASGGHVGFVAGKFPWRSEYWLEQRIPAFLKGYL